MQYVFSFNEGDGKDKQLLGGKGANLCEMTQIGLNVPPGFVISTATCLKYLEKKELPKSLMKQVKQQIDDLEQKTGKSFGKGHNPLLVSVRSGSAMSMPGMMDTILNLGLNQKTLPALIKQTGDERFAYDAFRRFIQLFGKVVLGIGDERFDLEFSKVKKQAKVSKDVELSAKHLKKISELFLSVVEQETGEPFPEDVHVQLELAIQAVFKSWMGKRAIDYRREFKITPAMANGTAVNVVTMVFGNMGNDSATGVAFTRNPATGENTLFGEYLTNAQGEDVVAGIRTPKPVMEMATEMPEMYCQLVDLRDKLEAHYHEVQDFEFTIEKGILYCLQTRNGKMNTTAMVRTSVEMVNDGLISKKDAIKRVKAESLDQVLHPCIDPSHKATPLATGLAASPGAASGQCVFDADKAELLGRRAGKKVILVREETKPEDIHGFFASQGILTSRGGKTSHAAVVARGMGKACVAGAEGIEVDVVKRQAIIGDNVLNEGDIITIDGGTGAVYLGELPMIEAHFSTELKTLLSWADEYASLKIMANADTPEAALQAKEYGAMGIGLCRTERMFNASERLPVVVDMILANNLEERQHALDLLLPMQREDFKQLYTTMSPNSVTIRLLDPPIHEFLPNEKTLEAELTILAKYREDLQGKRIVCNTLPLLNHSLSLSNDQLAGLDKEVDTVDATIAKKQQMLQKVRELFEVNPMLGHRGVRLGMTYPEIYVMQIRAALEAEAECIKEGIEVHPELMIPQVCTAHELMPIKENVDAIKKQVENYYGIELNFKFGTMIEVVRACMRSKELAGIAEFFSFGTNDLTQATFSFSREDAENKFLPLYNEMGILQDNPFEVLDTLGVGRLMKLSVEWGRKVRPDLKVGICGEQGGHPQSIEFCNKIGLNYVSCSAPRIPIARLAAAQAAL